jgi:DNA helicase-2/ATP-dependent DNA helicase PcrA
MAKKTAKPHVSATKSLTHRKTKKAETPSAPPALHASKYALGDRVSHPMFGQGTVTAIDGNKLTIQFTDNAVKQIIEGYVSYHKQ